MCSHSDSRSISCVVLQKAILLSRTRTHVQAAAAAIFSLSVTGLAEESTCAVISCDISQKPPFKATPVIDWCGDNEMRSQINTYFMVSNTSAQNAAATRHSLLSTLQHLTNFFCAFRSWPTRAAIQSLTFCLSFLN